MSQKLYKWEIALMVGVVTALLWGVSTARAQEDLAERVLRIHVIANSDSPEDQALKLAVRDAVLAAVEEAGECVSSPEEMVERLRPVLPQLEKKGEEVLRAQGCSDCVTAEITRCPFPTKHYDGFSFPAGEYTALRLTIGAGEGQNWWCVAFPQLCIGAGAVSVAQAVEAGHFTQEQGALLTAGGEGYVLKFKSMELLAAVKELFSRETD